MRGRQAIGIAAVLGLAACAVDADETSLATDEQDLTSSCTGPFKKVSELAFGDDARAFGFAAGHARGVSARLTDVDGDGHLDYLVVVSNAKRASALLHSFSAGFFRGDGHGNLAPAQVSSFEGHVGDEFRTADFDGDGRRDLFHQGTDGYEIFLQRADGTFGPAISVAIGAACKFSRGGEGYVTAVSVEDRDQDGKDDLRVSLVSADASGAEHALAIVHGTSSGLGAPDCQTRASSDAFGDEWFALRHTVRGDFNGDGKADIAGFGDLRNMFAALDVDGQPSAPVRLNRDNHNNRKYEAVAGRFDADSIDDAADLTMFGVAFYYGDKANPFAKKAAFEGLRAHAGLNTGNAFSGDFNGDGRTDFGWFDYNEAVVDGARLTPTVCSTANGQHRRYVTRLPLDDLHAEVVGVGDFDEDGRDDLLVSTFDDRFEATRTKTTSNPSRLLVFKK